MDETAGVVGLRAGHSLPVRLAATLRPLVIPDWLATALAYLGLTLLMRFFLLGNPVVHIDEQFYLFVAERMRDGALPYIDIWDRKPIGLFLVYEAFAAIPGDPVLAYQAGAVLATTATAMVIARIAREIASPAAAWQAGMAYVLFMPAFNSGLGQAPTFYNLLVALAAVSVIEAVKRPESETLIWRGAIAMALLGLAIQIKYTVLFEGLGFGLILLGRGYADAWKWRNLAAAALLWVTIALLPTMAAATFYANLGHFDDFVFANFVSIFARESDGWSAPWRLTKEMLTLLPFWLAIFYAPRLFSAQGGTHPQSRSVIMIWAGAAFGGFLLFGTWYDHYVAPLLVPLSVLAAPALARAVPSERWFGRLMLGFGALAGLAVPVYQFRVHGTSSQFAEMNALIGRELNGRCLYIYEGELAFYRTLNTCLPTTRIFPNHLNTYVEATAIGVDPVKELRKVLMSRPGVIVMRGPKEKPHQPNMETRQLINVHLAQDYERYATYRMGKKTYWLYRLRRPVKGIAASN